MDEVWNEFWSELWGDFGLVALVQRVGRTGAGLEVNGLLQQARDALHFELDGGGGDAPVVSAAHVGYSTMGSGLTAMLLGTHYWLDS
jgi:hypothetical protein